MAGSPYFTCARHLWKLNPQPRHQMLWIQVDNILCRMPTNSCDAHEHMFKQRGRLPAGTAAQGKVLKCWASRCKDTFDAQLKQKHKGRGRGIQRLLSPWAHTRSVALTSPGAAERSGSQSLTHSNINISYSNVQVTVVTFFGPAKTV
jgi:hypothetical protein